MSAGCSQDTIADPGESGHRTSSDREIEREQIENVGGSTYFASHGKDENKRGCEETYLDLFTLDPYPTTRCHHARDIISDRRVEDHLQDRRRRRVVSGRRTAVHVDKYTKRLHAFSISDASAQDGSVDAP